MVVGSPAHKKAVQSLWVGKATITVLDGVLNPRQWPHGAPGAHPGGRHPLPHFPQVCGEYRAQRGGRPGGPKRGALH